ncbi:MAG: DUF365 domain-containing protein [Candidatus Bathyarchaeia archaeon]|jgi:hypothetical protein
MSEIIGAIYPVPREFVDRLFDGKTKVFVKYVVHNTTKLAPRHKVIFYASHGSKKLVGEGTVEKVEFLSPEAVFAKYKERLFLNESEFYAYVGRSLSRTRSKMMLTLVLKKLHKFAQPVGYSRPITMAGQYLGINEYDSLIGKYK